MKKERNIKGLADVYSVDDMIFLLETKGRNHKYYYHYTSWNSLVKILEHQSFLLTRGNSLSINDQHEAIMKGSWKEWNKIYIGSFSFGTSENMAMWGLYGLPWEDAVRIEIPRKQMLRWIDSINEVGIWDNNSVQGYVKKIDVSLTDIVYVGGQRGKNNLVLTNNRDYIACSAERKLEGIDVDPRMTAYIKNYAWKYENEVRIRIRLKDSIGFEKIAVTIPSEIIDSINITTGPKFTWKKDELYRKLCNENKVQKSGFENLVKLKSLCSMCEHDFVMK